VRGTFPYRGRAGCAALCAVLAVMLAGCVNRPHRAPVEDRLGTPRATIVASTAASAPASPASAAETAKSIPEALAKPGYYAVKPGDTLIRIGLDNGQNWKDLVKWNALENPNVIEVGQMLRVVPPGTDPGIATTKAVSVARVETRPLTAPPSAGVASNPASSATAPGVVSTTPIAVAPVTAAPPLAAAPPQAPHDGDDDVRWAWPSNGNIVAPFEEGKVKGLVIGGKAGDPVLAAADGRVVYAGSGLRGYGNLIILKHNTTYLTAYAHNQTLLVKEEQNVRRGQKIAEMGSTDADGVQLHFEIRKLGKPIDPARLLPPR
jgi:lipoprotein NlpD